MRKVRTGTKSAEIYSSRSTEDSFQALSDFERGVLVGEGREAMARERCVRFRLKVGSWYLELLGKSRESES